MPCVALAGGFGQGIVSCVIDGQIECVGAGTALGIGIVVGVSAGGLVICVMPCVALAGGFG